jgi:CDP-glucose 4,6-dehydratase
MDALQGRRVWLTGHTGFMGSWLAVWLHRRGAQVYGFALDPPTTPSNYVLARVGELLIEDRRGDVRDPGAVRDAFEAARPDAVLHLAAQPIVRRSYRDPVDTFACNVMGTANVLDAVRLSARPCAVVVATTDKCYEPHADGSPHREEDRLGGHDPYAASKAAAELVVDAWRRSFFADGRVQVASVRAGNAIGGGDWAEDRIVPDAVRAAVAGRPLELRMPGAVRPWQHVLEPLSGYLRIVEHMLTAPSPPWSRGWNFAPEDTGSASVEALVARFEALWPGAAHVATGAHGQPHETRFLRLDASAARAELDWRPAWTWAEATDRTTRWYRTWAADPAGDLRAACLADISAHEEATR